MASGPCLVCGVPVGAAGGAAALISRPICICDTHLVCPVCLEANDSYQISESLERGTPFPVYEIRSKVPILVQGISAAYSVDCGVCGWGHRISTGDTRAETEVGQEIAAAVRRSLGITEVPVATCVSCGRRLGAATLTPSIEEQQRPVHLCNNCLRCPVCRKTLREAIVGNTRTGTSWSTALLNLSEGRHSGMYYGLECVSHCWALGATDVLGHFRAAEDVLTHSNRVNADTRSAPEHTELVRYASPELQRTTRRYQDKVLGYVDDLDPLVDVPVEELSYVLQPCMKCGGVLPRGHPFYSGEQTARICATCFICPYCEEPLAEGKSGRSLRSTVYRVECMGCHWSIENLVDFELMMADAGGRSPGVDSPTRVARKQPPQVISEFAGKAGSPMPRLWLNNVMKIEVD